MLRSAAIALAIATAREGLAQRPQTAAVQAPVGVREGPGYTSGVGVTASATSDGLVELVFASDTTHREFRSREPGVVRGFFPPAAVTAWLAAVDSLRAAVAGDIPMNRLARPLVLLADGDAIGVHASASDDGHQRHLRLSINGCRGGGGGRVGGVDEKEFPRLMASLTAAVEEAERRPNASEIAGVDARVYYEHAVGCSAMPFVSNPAPTYPAVPSAERRRREVLTQFVVDPDGLVEAASIAFAVDVDPRFAAAARSTLSRWRFTKPTRRGRPVRQQDHRALVFEPPIGDSVEAGCAMTGGAGAVVRPLTSAGRGTLETYLTHVATTFAIWFNPARIVGGSARFVVRSDGRVSDLSIDSLPPDSISRREFEMKLRSIPFILDPLPPAYQAEAVALRATFAPKCRSPRTALFWAQPTTFTPLPDGMIELANIHPSWASIWHTREQPPSRDVVTPEALAFFLDTTATLLPSENGKFPPVLDRWSGSLAEVPVLGYRGSLKGLMLGLTTQGELGGNINCGQTSGEWMGVRRQDLSEFWRIGREALAMRSSPEIGTDQSTNRAYEESEVACPAMPAVGNPAASYPGSIVGRARMSREVLVQLTVDTLGAVETRSIVTFPGTDTRFSQAVRAVVPQWRFRPALRGGKRVRQRVHMAVVVRPPEADAAVLTSKLIIAPDSSNRTIFRQRRPRP